jgi:hypothetical protein
MKTEPGSVIEVEVVEGEAVEKVEMGKRDGRRLAARYMQWATGAEFKASCLEYFEECDRKYETSIEEWKEEQAKSEWKSKTPIPAPVPYTHIGLCLYLGLSQRHELSIVGGQSEEFMRVQAWVNAKIEAQLTEAILVNSKFGISQTGALAIIKHVMGWAPAEGAEDAREEQVKLQVAESSRPQVAIFNTPEAAKVFIEARKAEQQKALGR